MVHPCLCLCLCSSHCLSMFLSVFRQKILCHVTLVIYLFWWAPSQTYSLLPNASSQTPYLLWIEITLNYVSWSLLLSVFCLKPSHLLLVSFTCFPISLCDTIYIYSSLHLCGCLLIFYLYPCHHHCLA